MLKFKKRLALIVFVIITLVLLLTFTSCGNSDTGTNASTETNSNINSDTNSNVDKEDDANTNTGTSDNTECEHILVVLTAVSPTCTQSGLSQGMKCSKCEKVITKQYEILPLNHDYIDHEAKEPTCTEIGWNEYQTCSRCDYTTYEEIKALGHKFVTYVSDGNATKESDGTKTSYCDNNGCNATDTITDVGSKLPIGYSDDLEYELNVDGASYTLSGIGSCNDKNVIIPSEYNGYPVTTIGVRAFANKQIETIQIPETVETISEYAFQSSSLKEVRMPSSVKLIEGWAFSYCQNLKEVYISDTVISIIYTAFFEAEGIEKFVVDENNNFYSSYNDAIYSKDKKRIYHYPIGKTEPDVAIHSAVEFIEIACFNKCKNIETITMSNNVVQIGSLSFKNCIKLKSITLSNNIKEIETSVFENCVSLKTVGLPNGISLIYYDAFKGCSSLEAIYIPSTVSTISDVNPFKGCVNLSTVYYEGSPEKWQSVMNYNVSNELLAADFVYNSKMLCNHEIVIDEARAPTCALVGLTEGSHCKWCNIVYKEQEEIETIEHNEQIVYGRDSTCELVGWTDGLVCSVCSEVLIKQEEIPKKTHTYQNSYICSVCEFVSAVPSKGLEFELDTETDTYIVTDNGECIDANIVIPHKYNDKLVTRIKSNAFAYCNNLSSIMIPNSVERIEYFAFYDCDKLEKVVIPNSIEIIENGAFHDCVSLTSVNYLGTIEEWCNILFNNRFANPLCFGANLYLNDVLVSDLVIPNTITRINNNAFSGCISLTNVTMSNTVTDIGEYAFYSCTNLKNVDFSDGVINIETRAFAYCSGLTNVKLSNHLEVIGALAFCDCTNLTRLETPNSVVSIGDSAFNGCTSLVNVTISNGTTSLGYRTFYNCTSLESIVIPNSVTTIGDSAFEGCTSLKYNEYDDAYYLGNGDNPYVVFIKAKNKDIICFQINQGTKVIYDSAFSDCSKLTSVIIPDSVTSIGSYAFYNCSSLTSVEIPDGVTEIGEYAFSECSSLTSVEIPDGVTEIREYTFSRCTSLTNIVIPDSVTSIEGWAFIYCTSLESLVIPSNVTSLESYLFTSCSSLTVYCEVASELNSWNSHWNYANCPVYWYSETEPTTEGNYWHYGTNGEIVVWE